MCGHVYMSVLSISLNLADIEYYISKDSHFKVMIDIDAALTVSTVSVATCLDQGLELAGNSLSIGTIC